MAAWFVRRPTPRGEPDGIGVAFLAGGARTAVWASLASLHSLGAVAVGADGQLIFPGPSPAQDTLPSAVLTALRGGTVPVVALTTTTGVAGAVGRLRDQLAADGWVGNRSATRRLLARLRSAERHLAPQLNPAWRVYGPNGAALAVALFGPNAIWQADPRFAKALGLPFLVAKQRSKRVSGVGQDDKDDKDADCGCA